MRKEIVNLEVNYFEKGDYVRTPKGVAIVVENEKIITNIDDLVYGAILIQYKCNAEDNISNIRERRDRGCLIPIEKGEYDEEQE
jgi:hypothetical protein